MCVVSVLCVFCVHVFMFYPFTLPFLFYDIGRRKATMLCGVSNLSLCVCVCVCVVSLLCVFLCACFYVLPFYFTFFIL